MRRISSCLLAGAAFAAVPTSALADSAQTRVTVMIPQACAIQTSPPMASDGLIDFGLVREFCNAPRGYDVIVDAPDAATRGTLFVDGRPIELRAAQTRIAFSDQPAFATRAIAFAPADRMAGAIDFTFRVAPR